MAIKEKITLEGVDQESRFDLWSENSFSNRTKRRDSCGFQCEVNGSLKGVSASLAVPEVSHAAVINVF